MPVKAVLIDDEQHNCETLSLLLKRYCPAVRVIAAYTDPQKAVQEIPELQPDLLFLDVLMPAMTGFDLLEQLGEQLSLKVIFVTAYNEYALKAIKFSALDYLLKPIEIEELQRAVAKAEKAQNVSSTVEQLQLLRENLESMQSGPKRIALTTLDGLIFVETKEIIRCEAESNYTIVHVKNGNTVAVSKSLIEFERLLGDFHFFRVHNSHLINVNHIAEYHRGDGGYLVMSDKALVDVSRRRKEAFLKRLNRI